MSETKNITVHLKVWRQKRNEKKGRFESYTVKDVSTDSSFLEMLDLLNEDLTKSGKEPLEFDSDCREGICGTCGLVINGVAHGPQQAIATCQLHMRKFKDGETLTIEPFRAKPFTPIKDLIVDRSAFDRIISKGGYVSTNAGSPQDANAILIPKKNSDLAMDAASCIGCGACVAACPNASASLFTSAKISQYALLPQGQPEATRRASQMVDQMDLEGFGNCSNHGECEAVCPKQITIANIARMRREFFKAALRS
ncbi:MAG: succinate dehydrogenase/fumarate reductase iron-sulfur subunit [candidate division Zixibacteria bacterium]|nr:succinate dehydrogenase/fumarate reductase iron-sulfur subunit [candidate division Zixibacteria bacterium]